MKHLRYLKKRSITLILIGILSVMLFACGKKEEAPVNENSFVPGEEYVYVPEFLSLDKEGLGDSGLRETVFQDRRLYYRYFNMDSVSWASISCFEYRELEDFHTVHTPQVSFSIEGYDTQLSSFTFDEEGNLYTIWYSYPMYVEGEEYNYQVLQIYLIKYNSQGEIDKTICLNDVFDASDVSWVSGIVVDREGYVYLSASDSQVYVLNKKLKLEQTIVAGNINNMLLMNGERVFAVRHNVQMELIELDKEAGTVKAVYGNIPSYNGFFADGGNGKLLYAGPARLYEYDLETQKSVVVMDWVESYVNGNYISGLQILEDVV